MILFLIVWAIVGFAVAVYLEKEGFYDSDSPASVIVPISIMCGPILWAAAIFGLLVGLVKIAIYLLNK